MYGLSLGCPICSHSDLAVGPWWTLATGTVGPASVGFHITRDSLLFGGSQVTATDIAVAADLVELGEPRLVAHLNRQAVERVRTTISEMIADGVDRMKTEATPLPLIACGGGAFLVPKQLDGISEVVQVEHHAVANAVGAAIAQVSGEVDRVFSEISRQQAIDQATEEAQQKAREAGADPEALEVIEVDDFPLAYLPGDARRVRVRVVGPAKPHLNVPTS